MKTNDYCKTREVLTRVHEFLSNLCKDARCDDHCSECIGASDLADDVHDLLQKPPRNCDRFATLEDAHKAHREICEEYGACNKACVYKSGHSGTYQCFEAWLFAPATEQKGENGADK